MQNDITTACRCWTSFHKKSNCILLLWIGVVKVIAGDSCVVVVLVVATLIPVAEVGDVICTDPLFCLLNDEDVLFLLAGRSQRKKCLIAPKNSDILKVSRIIDPLY